MKPAAAPRTKPLLRGVSHEVACIVATLGGLWLVSAATTTRAAIAAAIYAASLAAMFGISAAYHRPTWSAIARARMRRLDHAGIFLFIAGTYTPFCLLAMPESLSHTVLWSVWLGACVGLLQSLFWVHAPRPLVAALYIALGWVIAFAMPALHASIGTRGVALLLGGGIVYTVGAIVYAARRPDPVPKIFGYHEIFHALVVVASICHFDAVARVVLAG